MPVLSILMSMHMSYTHIDIHVYSNVYGHICTHTYTHLCTQICAHICTLSANFYSTCLYTGTPSIQPQCPASTILNIVVRLAQYFNKQY